MKKVLLYLLLIIIIVVIIFVTLFIFFRSKAEVLGDVDMDEIYLKVNDENLTIEVENNKAVLALIEKLKDKDINIKLQDYGSFEKVGSLGFSLPTSDKNIKTNAGDVMLYNGNQITIFYESNSWSYTRIGKIIGINKSDLKNILGEDDVEVILTLNK